MTGLRFEGMPDAAQVNLVIDREKANTFGVTFADINSTISANLGSSYINDFPNAGRMQRVTVQAEDEQRMQTADLLNLNVRNASGGMVPLSSFATVEWVRARRRSSATTAIRRCASAARPRRAIRRARRSPRWSASASELPAGFGYEWTGQSLQEIQSGIAGADPDRAELLFVFLCWRRSTKAGRSRSR